MLLDRTSVSLFTALFDQRRYSANTRGVFGQLIFLYCSGRADHPAFKPQQAEAEEKQLPALPPIQMIQDLLTISSYITTIFPSARTSLRRICSQTAYINPLTRFPRSAHLICVQNKPDFDLLSLHFVSLHMT